MPSLKAISRGVEPVPTPLRAVSPEEAEIWSDGDSDATLAEPHPSDIDDPWPYTFHPGDTVWVRTVGGNWHSGRVTGQTTRKGQTREKEGLFYPVVFNEKLRKYFAPLNGEIKPDTFHIRRLLKDAGWL